MELTYRSLKNINFPVFALSSDDVYMQDGLLKWDSFVVDDINQVGDTLGKRRLQTPHALLKLNRCFEDMQAFLTARGKRVFIDNKGIL
jgi:hypothetical protein